MIVKWLKSAIYEGVKYEINSVCELDISDEEKQRLIDHNSIIEIKDITVEEIQKLYEEYQKIIDFKKKVEFRISMDYRKISYYTELKDGTKIIFRLIPESPEEYLIYNTLHIDYYKDINYRCSFDKLKSRFEERFNKSINKEKCIEIELKEIEAYIERDGNYENHIKYNYNQYIKGIDTDLSKSVYKGIESYLIGKSLAEYEAWLKQLAKQEKPEGSTQNKYKNSKPEHTFLDFLISNNKEKLAELCEQVFSIDNSPKVFAIMFCLLSEKGFINVLNSSRKNIFKAWYKYINADLPKNENFYSINQFIIDHSANGFVFKDELDTDYHNCKRLFEKGLLSISKRKQ